MKKLYLILIIIISISFINSSILAQSTNIEWTSACVTNPAEPMSQTAHKFADLVKKLTAGRLTINVFDSGVLGGEEESLNTLQTGAIQLTTVNISALEELYPAITLWNAPGLFKDVDHCLRVILGDIGKEIYDGLLKSTGIRVLYTCYLGPTYFTSNKPLYKLDDFSGLRYRIGTMTEQFASICKALNAIPLAVPWADLYVALQTNIADMQENPPSSLVSAKLYEVQKYAMAVGFRHFISIGLIKEDLFQSLDSEMQNILVEAGKIASYYNTYLILEQELEAVNYLLEQGMVIITEKDGLEVDKIRGVIKENIWPKYIEKWGGQELVDRVLNE